MLSGDLTAQNLERGPSNADVPEEVLFEGLGRRQGRPTIVNPLRGIYTRHSE